MILCSVSSAYCHLLTLYLDEYEGLTEIRTLCIAAEITLSIVFSFAYLQHSSVVGEKMILLCLKTHAGGFFKPLQC